MAGAGHAINGAVVDAVIRGHGRAFAGVLGRWIDDNVQAGIGNSSSQRGSDLAMPPARIFRVLRSHAGAWER
jgi:hypothetical protein